MRRRNKKREVIAVDGAGKRVSFGSRCESMRDGKQCTYVVGHEGYHCDPNGLVTWETPDEAPR